MNTVKCVLLLAVGSMLTGCVMVPLPHVTRESPRLTGKVVDAKSGNPVEGAVVELSSCTSQAASYAYDSIRNENYSGAMAKTQHDGTFVIRQKYNFHLLWYANPSFYFHLPFGYYWTGIATVTRDGYRPTILERADKNPHALEVVKLVPVGSGP